MLTRLPLTFAAKPVGAPGAPPGLGRPDAAMRASRAALTLIIGCTIPLNGSVIGVPVTANAPRTVVTGAAGDGLLQDRPGAGDVRRRHRGTVLRPNPLLNTDELMLTPGARRSTAAESLLNTGTDGCPGTALGGHSVAPGQTPLVVAPTATAVEMHPGAEIAPPMPSFPEAMTEAIPTERRLSMAALVAALLASQLASPAGSRPGSCSPRQSG